MTEISTKRGYDVRDFALVVGGGAGPVHGAYVADRIEIPTVIIPRYVATYSAFGMLNMEVGKNFARSLLMRSGFLNVERRPGRCLRQSIARQSALRRQHGPSDHRIGGKRAVESGPGGRLRAGAKRYGHYIFGTDPASNEKYVVTSFDMDGGAGAVRGYDGYDGGTSIGALGEVNRGNVEEVEIRFPWRTCRWEFATDTAGAGKWRGASGIHWEVENVGGDAGIATGSSDGEVVRAPGALGGEPTPNSRSYLIREGDRQIIRGHRLY